MYRQYLGYLYPLIFNFTNIIKIITVKLIRLLFYITVNIYKNFLRFYSLDSKQIVQKYGSIIIDFAYFKSASAYEQKIENDPVSEKT